MNQHIKRPLSVWATQILLIIFMLLFAFVLINSFLRPAVHQSELLASGRLIVFVSIMLVLMAMLIAAFYGLTKRKVYGRWLGILSLIFIWGLITYTQLFPSPGPYKRYEYNNGAELAGAFFALSVVHALFLTLILRLAFAKKVKQFFDKGLGAGEL